MKKLKSYLMVKLLALCVVLVFGGQAYALTISPGDEFTNGHLVGVGNSQDGINTWLKDNFEPDLVELYKNDVGTGESGPLQGSYDTTFSTTATDPSEALIKYVGGSIITDAYLLVKDGNNTPYWYLFDLTGTETGLNWNGIEDLELSGFWDNQGGISHVSLYGQAAPVPEPATMLLLGTGLVCLAGVGRKKRIS